MRRKSLVLLMMAGIAALVGRYQYVRAASASASLLTGSWHLAGNNGAAEQAQTVNPTVLKGVESVQVTYDLHGLCALSGDASALIFDQNGWKYAALSKYGTNCQNGSQTVTIPVSDFKDINSGAALDTSKPLDGKMHVRFWYGQSFTVDITAITVAGTRGAQAPSTTPSPSPRPSATPLPTTAPAPTPAATPSVSGSWAIQSVDAMKDTKDVICGPRSQSWIDQWLNKAVEIGANYVAVSTPYDNPSCGNALAYTRQWVESIRARGLKVWHRHMPLAWEGIYSVAKSTSPDYVNMVKNYIAANPDLFQSGDIFTPIPEPQNGGIRGVTYCAQNVCQFSSKEQLNSWLRTMMTTSSEAFTAAGKSGVKVGYWGFDGFVVWGDNNPDWHGILEDTTIQQMGNITIDHYPELIGDTMSNDLNELQTRYPNIDIVIGEWGTVTGGNVEQQVKDSMGAAKRPHVIGFNYWQFGPSGAGEQLINNDFTNRAQYDEVQSFFKSR